MADMRKKVILPFFEPLKLLDCSCVRWHLRIPYDYRNGIGGIINVSFWSLCLFCEKMNEHKKYMIHGQSTKNRVFDGILRDLWKRADVICLCMRKFNIPERYKTVRVCTCE
jgi:hypothetical protein